MSKKVTRKASITNRPTCGGPIKAGLAPRSTNFMMGVKRNHHFREQPFKDENTDYACFEKDSKSPLYIYCCGNGVTPGCCERYEVSTSCMNQCDQCYICA